MNTSQAWEDIWNVRSCINTSTYKNLDTPSIVANIMRMLEVAWEQSENSNWKIALFFWKIENILAFMIWVQEIKSLKQAYFFHRRTMEQLGIPNIDTHIKTLFLLDEHPRNAHQLQISIGIINKEIGKWLLLKNAIENRWKEFDKNYFKSSVLTMPDYRELLESYSYQLNGVWFSKR